MPRPKVAQVAVFSPPFQTLTYLLPDYLPEDSWFAGQRVLVPMGRSLRAGLIGSFEVMTEKPEFKLRSILWPLEKEPLLAPWFCKLIEQIALRQTAYPGQILAGILPAGLRSSALSLRVWGEGRPKEIPLRNLRSKSSTEMKILADKWLEGLAEISERSLRRSEICVLKKDPPWPVRPMATVQISLLEHLLTHGSCSRQRLLAGKSASAGSALNTLVERGLISIQPETGLTIEDPEISPPPPVDHGFKLTDQQDKIYKNLEKSLLKALDNQKPSSHLLFGVTGSGKTAIYLELAAKSLARGHSVLFLAPEVALTYKLYNDVRSALPEAELYIYHGYLSPSIREQIFKELAANKKPVIVVGTRSALFLPVDNIGLIVLDEEHDTSFKQDEGLTYQAKEIAWYRAGLHKSLLLLGSATPDIKSFHAAKQGNIPIHILDERVGGGELPLVEMVRIDHQGAGTGTMGGLMPYSLDALKETVEAGDQTIILLNRRGYAPLMYCLGCGEVNKCPSCDIGLAYHKGRERLVCHYCGYTVPFPSPCPTCKSMNYLPMGEGTEKLEEHLGVALPPGTKVLRLDRDSTRRQGRMEEILASFARKEASVLVGTQMLSKGHHFPDVTLAIVADADLGLNLPDYRAAERSFQLIVQSSGRSGRGEKKGKVIIQTRTPDHYCWSFVKDANYEGFYQEEIKLRERHQYPPFINLALIRMSHPMDEPQLAQDVFKLGETLRTLGNDMELMVLGPAAAPLPFLKGRSRYHCLIKGKSWKKIRSLYLTALRSLKNTKLRISLDLDPVNML